MWELQWLPNSQTSPSSTATKATVWELQWLPSSQATTSFPAPQRPSRATVWELQWLPISPATTSYPAPQRPHLPRSTADQSRSWQPQGLQSQWWWAASTPRHHNFHTPQYPDGWPTIVQRQKGTCPPVCVRTLRQGKSGRQCFPIPGAPVPGAVKIV